VYSFMTMLKHFSIAALALVFVLGGFTASAAPAARPGTLRVATEAAFRPFNYLEGDQLKGFEVDLVNALAKHLKLKVKWTILPFDNLLTGLAKHRYDLVAASHAVTPERAKQVEFITPHYCTGAIIVTRKGGVGGTLTNLTDKTVAATSGTTYFDRLKAMPRFKEVKAYPENVDAIQAVASGEADAWVTDRFVAASVVNSSKGAELEIGDLIFPEMVAMAVGKGQTKLRDKLNAALATLMSDGTYEQISQRYFHLDIRCRNLGRRARSGAAGD
jgi:polar amino acid transport system substrate-binding protein